MAGTGTESTTLIFLRGNSASGKSTVASALRDRYGRGIAIVGQDNLRRIVLRERDVPGGAYIGLVDPVARYALDHGYAAAGTLNATVRRILRDTGLPAPGIVAPALPPG